MFSQALTQDFIKHLFAIQVYLLIEIEKEKKRIKIKSVFLSQTQLAFSAF